MIIWKRLPLTDGAALEITTDETVLPAIWRELTYHLRMNPTILLLGGGYTLQEVAERLDPASFVITSRSESRVAEFIRKGWIAVKVDTSTNVGVAEVFATHPSLTAVVDSIPPVAGDSDCTTGIRNILNAANRTVRYLYLSTTGVIGGVDGEWVDEMTELRPSNPLAHNRFACEQKYIRSGARICILRLPAIYGPGRGIGTSLQAGRYKMIEGGSRWSNRIHVVDLARSIVALLARDSWPHSLCVCDSTPSNTHEVVSYYCATFNLPWPETVTVEEAQRAKMHTSLTNQRVSNQQLRSSLGFELLFPGFREGASSEFGETAARAP